MWSLKEQQKQFKLTPIALVLAGLLSSNATMAISISKSNISQDKWLSPSDNISIELDTQVKPEQEELKFYIGKTDVTSLFKQTSPRKYSYNSSELALPRGTSEVLIYVNNYKKGWQEISRIPLNVKTALGFQKEEYTGAVNVSIRSELNNGFSGDAFAPQRQKETDMNTNVDLSMNATDENSNLSASANLVGVSHINQALQFGEKGEDADKLDLSSYQVTYNNANHNLTVGHVSYGNNRYLISGVGSRGVVYTGKPGENAALDYSMAMMNGKSIVGYANILGLNNNNHRITAATVGYEFINSRPGALRAELSYLKASILPFTNFGAGEIADAETSNGLGLVLSGSTESGDLRGSLTYARSKYTNPEDPFLSQGLDIVEVEENTDAARHIQLSYDVYQSEPDKQGKTYRVAISASHEKVDPLYKSLGAFASADKISNAVNIDIALKDINLTINKVTNQDNIDDIPSILTTRTESTAYGLRIPLKSILLDEQQGLNNWIPDLNISRNISHNFGVNAPPSFTVDSHIPDQYNVSDSYNLDWGFDTITLGLNYSETDRDNRQPARDTADFADINTGVTFNHMVNDKFSYNLGLSKSKNTDKEADLTFNNTNHSFGFVWNIRERLGLSVNYSESDADDSQDLETRKNMSGSISLAWGFDMTNLSSKKTPAQFTLDYSVNDGSTKNQVFGIDSFSRDWSLRAGLNIQLF